MRKDRPVTTGRRNTPTENTPTENTQELFSPINQRAKTSYNNQTRFGDTFVKYTKAERLNDPNLVHRPFSPENKETPVPTKKAFIQKSRDPTVPPVDSPPRRRKPSVCPQAYLDNEAKPDWFERVDSKAMVDERFKTEMARSFVEKNRDRLWQFNVDYMGKTPRTVCNEMCDKLNFMATMKLYNRRQNMLDRGISSHKMYNAMNEEGLEIPKSRQLAEDFFANSFHTPRDAKIARVNTILKPARLTMAGSYRRGALHDSDFGNFGRYSAALQKNDV